MSKAESNYDAHKLEFLALKWAVTEKCSDYLYGNQHKCCVYTDNNPLTYILPSAKLDATGHRWLAALASSDLKIRYRSGKSNVNADSLSRLPSKDNEDNSCNKLIDKDILNAIACGLTNSPLVETIRMSENIIHDNFTPDIVADVSETRKCQREDPNIGKILTLINAGKKPNIKNMKHELYRFCKDFEKFNFKRGLSHRVTSVGGEV